jgi:DNA-binding NarL/FixJ family response regulator/two-component sensor histidine kinase
MNRAPGRRRPDAVPNQERRSEGEEPLDYRVIRAQEEERKRLARDLHDGLAQSLVGMGINLELVERHLEHDPVQRAEAVELLTRLREQAAGCLEEVRRILSDLRPLDLDGRSLSRALKDYAERFSTATALKTTVVISGQEARLHPSLETGLFRIFQEALNNVRDHAEAREVSLKLRFQARSVSMDISDDGRGFTFDGNFDELAERRCFGLIGIKERVELLGGHWRVSSGAGKGTEIRVRLPVHSPGGFWSFLSQRGSPGKESPGGAPPVRGKDSRSRENGPKGWPAKAPVRLLIADDHRVVREGLKMIFETVRGLQVVGEASDGEEAVHLCRELAPDVVLMDLVMPGPGPAEAIRQMQRTNPKTAVLVLTAHHNPEQVRQLLAAGATGYLLKTADASELIGAVQAAATGVSPLAPEALKALSEPDEPEDTGSEAQTEIRPERPGPSLPDLTLRERDIVDYIGQGLTNEEIARKLFISEKTVRNHLGAVIRKLGVRDRTQVALAARGLRPGRQP